MNADEAFDSLPRSVTGAPPTAVHYVRTYAQGPAYLIRFPGQRSWIRATPSQAFQALQAKDSGIECEAEA